METPEKQKIIITQNVCNYRYYYSRLPEGGGGGGDEGRRRGGEMQNWPFLGKFIVERVTDAKARKTPQFCFSS